MAKLRALLPDRNRYGVDTEEVTGQVRVTVPMPITCRLSVVAMFAVDRRRPPREPGDVT
ncbi:hypothetical protein ACTMTJ_44935 [Phytohabitans sp. LJ34]|uniref:hypothetical protein n=1 Tax=Phytohabitans sp. LJ34 TaxID=3452217 RepID=UPI003F8A856F